MSCRSKPAQVFVNHGEETAARTLANRIREEWDVALHPAGLYRIFEDRLREAWFVEGELD